MVDLADAGSTDAPRIFFSYASENRYWVNAFKQQFDAVGTVRILDYLADKELGYGELSPALDDQMQRSVVVVAFVSSNYRSKKWTIAEWERALNESQRRRLIFVPIMLDADAKIWWQRLRQSGKLTDLSMDYQYEDFTDAGGITLEISPNDTRATGKIARLAARIRRDLQRTLIPQEGDRRSKEVGSGGASGTPQIGAPVNGVDVVILGHPTAAMPSEIIGCVEELCGALERKSFRCQRWGDGWRRDQSKREDLDFFPELIFVQPISIGEASDRIADRDVIGRYLNEAGIHSTDEAGTRYAKVVLWLPEGYDDPDFDAAVVASVNSNGFPAPRHDTPNALAEWLELTKIPFSSTGETRIQVETMGFSEGTKPEQALVSQRIIQQLKDEILSIANTYVDNPPPKPPPWPFFDTQFKQQIKKLAGTRTIIAIHDLDVRPGDGRMIEKQLQIKFDKIQKALDEDQEARRVAGKPVLNTFLTALLVNNAEALPFSSYPDDGRYGRWRLLGFEPADESAASRETPSLRPDPASLAVFKLNLQAWAHSS